MGTVELWYGLQSYSPLTMAGLTYEREFQLVLMVCLLPSLLRRFLFLSCVYPHSPCRGVVALAAG